MSKHHLDRRELERLEEGELSQAETTEISRHLIQCPRCRRALDGLSSEAAGLLKGLLHDLAREGLLPPSSASEEVCEVLSRRPCMDENRIIGDNRRIVAYSDVDRDVDRDADCPREIELAKEWEKPDRLWEELRELDPVSLHRRVCRRPCRYRGLELAKRLLDSAWEVRADPMAAEELSRAALEVLDHTEADIGDQPRLRDAIARAWANIANAHRIRHQMAEAERAFEKAEEHLAQGTRDPRKRAPVLSMKGVMLSRQHRFEEAQKHYDQAAAIHHWAGNLEGEVMCRISKANAYELAGDLDQAIATLEEAESLVPDGVEVEPYLMICLQQNRALCLVQADRIEEAQRLLPEVRKFVERDGMRHNRFRLQLLEARVARKRGDTAKAEKLLRQVRGHFLEEDLGYDAALASLHLAALLLDEGRTAETRELAQEMLHVFNRLDIQREAFAALILFQQAALKEEATVAMVRDIVSFLERSSTNPALRYETPS